MEIGRNPLRELDEHIAQKRALYASMGRNNNGDSMYATIWGVPSSEIAGRGYGPTLHAALCAALDQMCPPVVQRTRPLLPGLKR